MVSEPESSINTASVRISDGEAHDIVAKQMTRSHLGMISYFTRQHNVEQGTRAYLFSRD
jgi:hypothetical protein